MKLNTMSYAERLQFFSRGRVTTGKITQVIDKKLVDFHVGKLRGIIVQDVKGNFKFATVDEARAAAQWFLDSVKSEVLAKV